MNKSILQFCALVLLVVAVGAVGGALITLHYAGNGQPGTLGFGQDNGNPIFQNGLRTGLNTLYQVLDGSGGVAAQTLTVVNTGTFRGGLTDTGTKSILTAGATTSISGVNVCSGKYFEFAPTVANATATLPTQAVLNAACLTTTGDEQSIYLKNTSVTASTTLLAAGASTTIVYMNASTTVSNGAPSTLSGGSIFKLTFVNTSSSDPTSGITVFAQQYK